VQGDHVRRGVLHGQRIVPRHYGLSPWYCGDMRKRTPLSVRFWTKVTVGAPDDCWPWTGSTDRKGYGKIASGGLEGRLLGAHRVSYEFAYGPVPEGLNVLHSCDNPPCVNPAHLRAGTQADNIHDAVDRERLWMTKVTHCKNGHEYSADNTRYYGTHRYCIACEKARTKGLGRGGYWRNKTHCIHGHEFTPENTYTTKRGGRECRICGRARVAAYLRRKKG
jgi:hypothetical protein